MKSAVLIGMSYINSEKFIPGILIDVYIMHKFLRHNGWVNIKVITDIPENANILDDVDTAIFSKHVDGGILSFLEGLESEGNLHRFIDRNSVIKSFNATDERILIYYTGHSAAGAYLLPNHDIITMEYMIKAISSNNTINERIIINDCCGFSNVNIPYTLNKDYKFTLTGSLFAKDKILCITSGKNHGDSLGTVNGSIFTKAFVDALRDALKLDILGEQKALKWDKFLTSISSKMLAIRKELTVDHGKLDHISVKPHVSATYPTLCCLPAWVTHDGIVNVDMRNAHLYIKCR